MKHLIKTALLAGALGASSFLIAGPASAHDYRRSSSVSVYVGTGPVAVQYSRYRDSGPRHWRRCRVYRHHRCYARWDRGRHYGWRRGRHRGWDD
jgi:hypothetical protein